MTFLQTLDRFYHHRYRLRYVNAKTVFVMDSILILIIIGLLAAVLFLVIKKPTLAHAVDLSIKAPQEIVAGEPLALEVDYRNNNSATLKNLNWKILAEDGWVLINNSASENSLPDLPPNTSGSFVVRAIQYQTKNFSEQPVVTIRLRLNFTDEKNSPPESRTAVWQPKIIKNNFAFAVVAPDKIIAGQKIDYQINFAASLPADVPTQLKINGVAATTTGSFLPAAAGDYKIEAQLNSVTENKWPLFASTKIIKVLPSPLAFTWQPNEPWVHVGQNVSGKIIIKNTGEQNLQIKNIILPLAKNIFVGNGSDLILSAEKYQGLADLKSGDSIEMPVALGKLKSLSPANLNSAGNLEIVPRATAWLPELNLQTWNLTPLILPVETKLSVRTGAQYFDELGDQLGRGPWPPKISKETRLWIYTHLATDLHTIKNGTLQINLAPGVTTTGKRTVLGNAEIKFVTNQVSGSITEINPSEPLVIGFEILVIPTEQPALLIKSTNFSALDSITNSSVQTSGGNVLAP